jgi:hypothetical protein
VNRASNEFESDELDALLRRAMQSRPAPATPADLASRALAIARETEAALPPIAVLSRVRWWNRVATAVAAVVILAIAGWVFRANLRAGGFQPWSDTGVSSSDTSASSTASASAATSSNTTEWMFIGVGLAVTSVGILAAQRTIGGGDEWMVRWAALSRMPPISNS